MSISEDEWGYDKYTGVCHIIPNAGVVVLALLYGKGDFSRTIEIATMCGWDTDCNAGNVGTITGVFNGIDGIPDHYRKPINDTIVTSSVSGYLNILDIPTFCKELVIMGYELSGEKAPNTLTESVRYGEVYFDFRLPGSTHGFKTSNNFKTLLKHSNDVGFHHKGSLEVLFDRMVDGDQSKIFYKPFYRREDFNDEKYKPTFSPKAYSGQIVSVKIYLDKWQGEEVYITPYVRNTFNKEDLKLQPIVLKNHQWNDVEFVIPELGGAMIDEVGYIVESPSPLTNRAFGKLFIDEFHIHGNAQYTIDFNKQAIEFKSITPFAHHRGEWLLEDGYMSCTAYEDATSYTGNYYTRNFELESDISPIEGESHGLIFRSLGTERYYFIGFDGDGQVSLIKNDFGYKKIKTVSYQWKKGINYHFKIIVLGDQINFEINGDKVLSHKGLDFAYGMVGFGLLNKGKSEFHSFQLTEKN
nr:ADP-ribosylglycohydrolase family protein [Tuberibacillus calidus]